MTRLCWLIGGLLTLVTGASSAQSSFTVTPLGVNLSGHAPAAVIDVINTSPGSLTMQVQQRSWTQPDGRDQQGDIRDLIISPAIFTLQSGEKQVVRIALRGAPDLRVERAYRIIVSEVPTPQLKVTPDATSFRVALRMDLPLFVEPLQQAQPEAGYSFDSASSRLVVRNSGNRHIRYTDAALFQAGRKVTDLPVFTVLAGGSRVFDLPRERVALGSELRLQAESNAGPIDAAANAAR